MIAICEDNDDVLWTGTSTRRVSSSMRVTSWSSFFFEMGLRVNANANIHRMDTVMMEGVAGHVIMCSSRTAHLPHGANKTQAYLEEKLKELWPKNNWLSQLGRPILVIASYGRL